MAANIGADYYLLRIIRNYIVRLGNKSARAALYDKRVASPSAGEPCYQNGESRI